MGTSIIREVINDLSLERFRLEEESLGHSRAILILNHILFCVENDVQITQKDRCEDTMYFHLDLHKNIKKIIKVFLSHDKIGGKENG